MAALITPNVPEAELLAGIEIDDLDAMRAAAEIFADPGCAGPCC